MRIQKLNAVAGGKAYNILCKPIYSPGKNETRAPFGSTLCEIEPGGHATKHSHLDQESFFILKGKGTLQIDDEQSEIEAGDVILIPSHSQHRIENTSTDTPLEFLSTYWIAPVAGKSAPHTLVIPAPPTPNGPLHLGHLSGPYLAADVYARAQRAKGLNGLLALGTDDNQCYVPAKARQLGLSPEQVCQKFTPMISGVLERFGCELSYFLNPLNRSNYTDFVQEKFSQLVEKGVFELREAPTLYCESSNRFIYGAQVSGQCPHCGSSTGGNGCEDCGHYNDCVDLKNPASNLGKGPVKIKTIPRYYFPLSKHADLLNDLLEQIEMHPSLRQFYKNYLEQGLPDVSVSHPGEWGIPVPGKKDQVVYEWAEMAFGYLYMAHEVATSEQLPDFWRSQEAGLVESFGFDNSFFYGLLLPALMSDIDPTIRPPRAFLSNYFYQLDGKKFSTSRNHAVWGHEILEAVAADPLRIYLSLTRSEDGGSNFSLENLSAFIRTELVESWEALFELVDEELTLNSGAWESVDRMNAQQEAYLLEATALLWKIDAAYGVENFSLRKAARYLSEGVHLSRDFLSRNQSVDRAKNLSVALSALKAWIAYLSPIAPQVAKELSADLGLEPMAGEIPLNQTTRKLKPFGYKGFTKAYADLEKFARGYQ